MTDTPHVCRTCSLATWQLTATGRRKKDMIGRCQWAGSIKVPCTVASEVRLRIKAATGHGIFWDSDDVCETWEPKEGARS